MKVLLDTNAYAALMKGHPDTAERVRRAERVFLSAVVAGEFMFGFRNGSRYEKNMREFEDFTRNPYTENFACD